jgi:N-acetylglucosaminyldiphosphoundecaprenol N-acetyl-beta-D-mannosaminyltransferase
MGVRFAPITEAECVATIVDDCARGRGGWLVTPNLDILRQCVRSPEVRQLVDGADLLVADGAPLILASRLLGTPLPERVCGSDLMSSLPAAAAARGLSLFLLGGNEGVAEDAARLLRERHPDLRVAGTLHPELGFEDRQESLDAIGAALAAARPDIVFVALSFPKGERLIARLRPLLPAAWWIGVGIAFSFLTGDVRRAPRWMQRTGLEWVFRLTQEPERLARRYLVDGLPFAARLLAWACARRLGGGEARQHPA